MGNNQRVHSAKQIYDFEEKMVKMTNLKENLSNPGKTIQTTATPTLAEPKMMSRGKGHWINLTTDGQLLH